MKRVLASVLAALLVIGLTGCSLPMFEKAPTAESLVKGIEELDADKYYNMELALTAETEEDGKEVSIDLEAAIEGKGDILHLYDTEAEIGASGFSLSIEVEAWLDLDAEEGYINASAMGENSGWMKSDMSGGDSISPKDIEKLANAMCDMDVDKVEPELQKHEKGEDYVVIWEADADDIIDAINEAAESVDMLDDVASVNDSAIDKVVVEARFDEKTKDLTSLSIKASGDATLEVEIKFIEKNGSKSLSIPKSVIKEAGNNGGGPDIEIDPDPNTPEDPVIPFVPVDPGEEEDPAQPVITDSRIKNDGAGYDSVIDPLANEIAARDPDFVYLSVGHYGSDNNSAVLNYSAAGGSADWSGSLEIEHISKTSEYYSAKRDFESECSFLADWYGTDQIAGGKDDDYIVFTKNDYGRQVQFAARVGDEYFIKGSMYNYKSDDINDAAALLNTMLKTAGISDLFTLPKL